MAVGKEYLESIISNKITQDDIITFLQNSREYHYEELDKKFKDKFINILKDKLNNTTILNKIKPLVISLNIHIEIYDAILKLYFNPFEDFKNRVNYKIYNKPKNELIEIFSYYDSLIKGNEYQIASCYFISIKTAYLNYLLDKNDIETIIRYINHFCIFDDNFKGKNNSVLDYNILKELIIQKEKGKEGYTPLFNIIEGGNSNLELELTPVNHNDEINKCLALDYKINNFKITLKDYNDEEIEDKVYDLIYLIMSKTINVFSYNTITNSSYISLLNSISLIDSLIKTYLGSIPDYCNDTYIIYDNTIKKVICDYMKICYNFNLHFKNIVNYNLMDDIYKIYDSFYLQISLFMFFNNDIIYNYNNEILFKINMYELIFNNTRIKNNIIDTKLYQDNIIHYMNIVYNYECCDNIHKCDEKNLFKHSKEFLNNITYIINRNLNPLTNKYSFNNYYGKIFKLISLNEYIDNIPMEKIYYFFNIADNPDSFSTLCYLFLHKIIKNKDTRFIFKYNIIINEFKYLNNKYLIKGLINLIINGCIIPMNFNDVNKVTEILFEMSHSIFGFMRNKVKELDVTRFKYYFDINMKVMYYNLKILNTVLLNSINYKNCYTRVSSLKNNSSIYNFDLIFEDYFDFINSFKKLYDASLIDKDEFIMSTKEEINKFAESYYAYIISRIKSIDKPNKFLNILKSIEDFHNNEIIKRNTGIIHNNTFYNLYNFNIELKDDFIKEIINKCIFFIKNTPNNNSIPKLYPKIAFLIRYLSLDSLYSIIADNRDTLFNNNDILKNEVFNVILSKNNLEFKNLDSEKKIETMASFIKEYIKDFNFNLNANDWKKCFPVFWGSIKKSYNMEEKNYLNLNANSGFLSNDAKNIIKYLYSIKKYNSIINILKLYNYDKYDYISKDDITISNNVNLNYFKTITRFNDLSLKLLSIKKYYEGLDYYNDLKFMKPIFFTNSSSVTRLPVYGIIDVHNKSLLFIIGKNKVNYCQNSELNDYCEIEKYIPEYEFEMDVLDLKNNSGNTNNIIGIELKFEDI